MNIVQDEFSCGVRTVIAKTEGVCSQYIELKLFGEEIVDVTFYGNKSTSCPDQFAQMLEALKN